MTDPKLTLRFAAFQIRATDPLAVRIAGRLAALLLLLCAAHLIILAG